MNATEQYIPDDKLCTPAEAAEFLRIEERTLLNNARQRRIPVVRINARVLRFHLPSVLAALQTKGAR
jgi:hypothetical protein